jgi:hypothetical protein
MDRHANTASVVPDPQGLEFPVELFIFFILFAVVTFFMANLRKLYLVVTWGILRGAAILF